MAVNQKEHWNSVFSGDPSYFGDSPSLFCTRCIDMMKTSKCTSVLELGSGQGRDTKYLVDSGMKVIAIDYSETACNQLQNSFGNGIVMMQADLREGIDLPRASVDACFSHMLLTMDFTDEQLFRLMADLKKVVVPGGLIMFSVRNQRDPGFEKGENIHGSVWESGKGFAVRYYSESDVRRFSEGFTVESITECSEDCKILYYVILRN